SLSGNDFPAVLPSSQVAIRCLARSSSKKIRKAETGMSQGSPDRGRIAPGTLGFGKQSAKLGLAACLADHVGARKPSRLQDVGFPRESSRNSDQERSHDLAVRTSCQLVRL